MATGTLAFVAVLLAILLLVAGFRLAGLRASARARARARAGVRGEDGAARLLEREGYAIEGRQVEREAFVVVDGAPLAYSVRADLLARCRAGRLHVVEVKTGGRAPDPRHPPTRRQLLEYALVFGTGRVLLVDMEAGEIHEIGFDVSERRLLAAAQG